MYTTYDLTKREKDIMILLWKSDKPLTAFEISKKGGEISTNTIQTVFKKV